MHASHPPTPTNSLPCHRQRYYWPTFSLTSAQTTAQAGPAQIWDPTGGTTFPSTGEISRTGGIKAHASGPVVNMVWRDCQQAASRRRETEGFGGRGGAAQKCAAPRTICPGIIRLYGSGFQLLESASKMVPHIRRFTSEIYHLNLNYDCFTVN